MKCKKCQVNLAQSSKFCHECGVPVTQPEKISCPNPTCGSRQSSASKFCSECQYEFALASQCTGCRKLVDCKSKFCNGCRTRNVCYQNQDDSSASIDKTTNIESSKQTDNDDNGGSITDNQQDTGSGNSTDDRKPDIDDELDSKPKQDVMTKETDAGTTESKLPLVTNQYDGSVEKRKNSRKGLAVICVHQKFSVPSIKLGVRENAYDDQEIMDKAFKGLDFEVFSPDVDQETKFYENDLCEESNENDLCEQINNRMESKDFLVFVLSTHGDERREGKGDNTEYNHYFYTKDGQCQTQQLMDKIAKLKHMKDKMVVYVIQACRSTAMNTDTQNMDLGVDISVQSKLTLSTNGSPVDHSDAVGRLPPQSGSIDIEDARGYIPPPEDKEPPPPITPPAVQRQLSPAASQNDPVAVKSVVTMKEHVQIPVQEIATLNIPHSDNCVVVFASMSGKYAYSRVNADDSGGWLIRALSEALKEYKDCEPIHILDVLTKVNQKVSQKENILRIDKSNHDGLKNRCEKSLNVIIENFKVWKNQDPVAPYIQNWLDHEKETVDSLLEHCEKTLGELRGHTELEQLKEFIDKQVNSLISRIEKVLLISVKAQSCVFYNIAMDKDRDYYLRYFDD